MEVVIFLLLWFWWMGSKGIGELLARVDAWREFYRARPSAAMKRHMVVARAQNIKRIRNERFKNNKS